MFSSPLKRWLPRAAPEAVSLLRADRGLIDAPIRAEVFGSARMQQHGLSLGLAQIVGAKSARRSTFFPRIRHNIGNLREAHAYMAMQEIAGNHVSPAGNWLLENFHLVVAQIKEIHDGLPWHYFRDLPTLAESPLEGLPRVYGIAWAYVAHTDSGLDEGLLIDFLGAYQQSSELTLGELWALPTTLRVVLLENLSRLSERVATAKAAREMANLWCDDILLGPAVELGQLLAYLARRGVTRPFALQVMQRIESHMWIPFAPTLPERQQLLDGVMRVLEAALPDRAQALLAQQSQEAADNLSVSNTITTLRLLGHADWRGLILRTSLLMKQMDASPVFREEREDTQDASLHRIERLAKKHGLSEGQVAKALIDLTTSASDRLSSTPRHWLEGPGRPMLEEALGLSPLKWPRCLGRGSWSRRQHGHGHGHGHGQGHRLVLFSYLGCILLGSLGLTAWLLWQLAQTAMPWPGPSAWKLVLALLAIWPASEVVMALINRLLAESVSPRRLPRLALPCGIPAEHRVLVVMPVLLTDTATVQALVGQLERHHLANPEAHAQFALLSDFVDAQACSLAEDQGILDGAMALIDDLEARYRCGHRRFLLLHRPRRWCPSEGMWIGWERKRGKLTELMAWIVERGPSPFMDLGEGSRLFLDTPHVMTLDSDTVLPPGSLRDLVGVAAHPSNQPVVDASLGRVVCGYGILQPSMVTPMAPRGSRSIHHWLFAGQSGIDPYSALSSEVYQDLFGEGTFSGKGLLNVAAMHAVLGHHLPQGTLLSHDALEGCLARCAAVSDIMLIEDAPQSMHVANLRLHRWTRGDWQLLPLLLRWRHFRLGALHAWKLMDNLRRSLIEPMCLGLMFAALLVSTHFAWLALMLVIAALGAGPVLGAIAAMVPGRADLAWRPFLRLAWTDLGRAIAGMVWRVLLLWGQAGVMLDAISRSLYRVWWSHRDLLQWTTTAATASTAAHGAPRLRPGTLRWHGHGVLSIGPPAAFAGLVLLHTPAPLLALPIVALWSLGPYWRHLASHPWPFGASTPSQLSPIDRDYLFSLARDTWRLFEQYVGPETQHLPPDNVQTLPYTIVAQRTSPTNIGLYLLSVACAREFGWIDMNECLSRCEATLETLSRMSRHRGHFLNWYDTHSLEPLLPAYVSTVDSGNLCGHLLGLAGAFDAWALQARSSPHLGHHLGLVMRLRGLSKRLLELACEPEFGFLFDAKRRLLHIGCRVAEQQLDRGYYDLLASEARLASAWAVAKGDIPVSHWAALGRPHFASGASIGLRSWSGSMFEYLMPALVLDELSPSAIGQAALVAVREHIAYGQQMDLPWGMSESAYAAIDQSLAYQYAPHGVPRLALMRTSTQERVVAPYASALAAMLEPSLACSNLRRLERLHARSSLGFMDAIDFTPDRLSIGGQPNLVSTYMAHHQGMIIVALGNVLLDGAPRRWCMSMPHFACIASMWQERLPRCLPRSPQASDLDRQAKPTSETYATASRELIPGEQGLPPTQVLSNGRYSVSLRPNGSGWSRFQGADISRWRDDVLRDAYGSFLYLRRHPDLPAASLTQHPAPSPQARYLATFQDDRVQFDARWPDVHTRCTVWVSPEDDIELRQIEIWNTSPEILKLELISAFEVSLNDANADETHPAFNNLFVKVDWAPQDRALFLMRRPRLGTEASLHAVHFIAHADASLGDVRHQADRARWMGRHRDATHPMARFEATHAGGGECITGLDPVAALSVQITLAPHGSAQLTLGTAAAPQRATLEALVDRYHRPELIDRSSLMSSTLMGIRLREMRMPPDDRSAVRMLTTAMALTISRPGLLGLSRPQTCNRQRLWRLGLSGERPLIVVKIREIQGLRMVNSLIQAHRMWSWAGLACDLVVINEEVQTYLMPVRSALQAMHERHIADAGATDRGQGLHLFAQADLSDGERDTLSMLARVKLDADGRTLSRHLLLLSDWHDQALRARAHQTHSDLRLARPDAKVQHAQGQFAPDKAAFSFTVSAKYKPTRPWLNVLANPDFGSQVSETGDGYTWAGNSKLNQITAWTNDPISDASGEGFYVQDRLSGDAWSIGPGCGHADTTYLVTHRQGSTTISHGHKGLTIEATWTVDVDAAIKRVRIVIGNTREGTRELRILGAMEWLLGARRSDRHTIRTAFESSPTSHGLGRSVDALLATQQDEALGAAGQTAFFMLLSEAPTDAALSEWTCDRRELHDASGQRVLPDLLGRSAGAGLDPCAVAARVFTIPCGQVRSCVFILGHARSPDAAMDLAVRASQASTTSQQARTSQQWDRLLGTVEVRTPDPLFDAMVNRWLLYQTIGCRLWARSGFYQAGGAYGFRDQLQDAMALALTAPQMLRAQLLLSASRQFLQGDVQHWWHGPSGIGVRTHCSDDLLWLPQACLHYVQATGEREIWDEQAAFLEGQAIADGHEDAYFLPEISEHRASLYEHCARAIDRALEFGRHGLPLMGSGDWNDGMNRVGHLGQGESVWLGWLLVQLLGEFSGIAEARGDGARATPWLQAGFALRTALQQKAWDGEWFVRAFFDDGSALGSHSNSACRIDLIAQAWSVLSKGATPAQQVQAMDSVKRWLTNDDAGLIALLDPPLTDQEPSAGYIQAYPPGVRENGGQYNHAAVWALMAQAALGDGDGAYLTFTRLSPAHRSANKHQGPAYGLEPYVMAGDIYTQPPYIGRGGWSWYTGSAAWMYRAAIESICGLRVQGDQARMLPQLPSHWPSIRVTLRSHDHEHTFIVCAVSALQEIAQARAQGAHPLSVGAWVSLRDGPQQSTHLVVPTV